MKKVLLIKNIILVTSVKFYFIQNNKKEAWKKEREKKACFK